jgi:CspA family cold shock protein
MTAALFQSKTGKVKWFDATKGYGFIQPTDASPDVFCHITAVQAACIDELIEGDTVEYVVEAFRDGRPRATRLRLVRSAA